MTTKIELQFDDTKSSIIGDELGRKTFLTQVMPNINDYKNFDKAGIKYEIVFPNNVSLITSSFVQGFSNKIVSDFGKKAFKDNIEITAASKDIENDFIEDL